MGEAGVKTVWALITGGAGSWEFHVIGVYSSREKAEAAREKSPIGEDAEIVEWQLDPEEGW